MNRTHVIALAVGLIALALVPLGLRNYGIYLITLWCVYVMAGLPARAETRKTLLSQFVWPHSSLR